MTPRSLTVRTCSIPARSLKIFLLKFAATSTCKHNSNSHTKTATSNIVISFPLCASKKKKHKKSVEARRCVDRKTVRLVSPWTVQRFVPGDWKKTKNRSSVKATYDQLPNWTDSPTRNILIEKCKQLSPRQESYATICCMIGLRMFINR